MRYNFNACIHLQAAITAVQQAATARVIAIRKEAGRWVTQANQDAEDAKAGRIKAEAQLAAFRSTMAEKVRNAVLKTSEKERERSAQALAKEKGEVQRKALRYLRVLNLQFMFWRGSVPRTSPDEGARSQP